MKMTERAKKDLVISVGAVVCIALIAAIGTRFKTKPAGAGELTKESPTVTEAVIDPSKPMATEKSTEEETELVIQPETGTAEDRTEPAKPVDSRPAQTDQTKQSIQPEVTKPAPPSEEVLKDPTAKPDGTKVETAPALPETESAVDHQPQGGDTKDGKTYFPGFGWVEGTGDAQGTTAADMYENGNKIGEMGE